MSRDDRIERYMAGEMSASEKAAVEREALADPALFEALYGDAALGEKLEAASTESARRPWRFRARTGVVAALAAAAMLVVLVRTTETPDAPVFRGHEDRPVGLVPEGDRVELPVRFRWTHSGDAASYRFELLTSEAVVLVETIVTDSTLTLPAADSKGMSGARYFWRVTPLDFDGNPGPASDPIWFTWPPAGAGG